MQRFVCFLIFCFGAVLFAAEPVFHDATPWLEGIAFEGTPPFSRLPQAAEALVRPPVWRLSRNSAGIAAHFVTDATEIHVRWEVLNDFHMVHMAGTGIRGVDLYVRTEKGWSFVAAGKPYQAANTAQLIKNLNGESGEYLLYCPLYDGLKSLEIGTDPDAVIEGAARREKPLVFYGTSITQGGCASRPGMAYPAIIGRSLDRETVNLGFSGNGRMEPEMIRYLSGIDAACFILDCLPNMDLALIRSNAEAGIREILEARPGTPLLLVPSFMPENGWHDPAVYGEIVAKNEELEAIYDRLKKEFKNLDYIPFKDIRNVPVEGTVDGVHLTDLGQTRMAEVLGKRIRKLIR